MSKPIRAYVRVVESINRRIGRFAMYILFVMMAILLWSSMSKVLFVPSLWTLEMAQFAMVAFYMLGGPYSIQLGSNVRMDLFYSAWSPRRKAWTDAFTVLFLIFYLVVLLWGALSSTAYSLGHFSNDAFGFYGTLIGAFVTGGPEAAAAELGHLERSATAWRAYLWPVKVIMCIGIFLMLLQAVSELFKSVLFIREGEA
ncbi:MAG: TRAP transporter small permease subunit [Hyphomicrobiales bacterium]|nr:TRAP transporter small permease subunit [Hyphomicrobiales bacterium]